MTQMAWIAAFRGVQGCMPDYLTHLLQSVGFFLSVIKAWSGPARIRGVFDSKFRAKSFPSHRFIIAFLLNTCPTRGPERPPFHVHLNTRKTRLLKRNKEGPSGMSNYDH